MWLRFGSGLVQVWFRHALWMDFSRHGSNLVQGGFKFGSCVGLPGEVQGRLVVHVWLRASCGLGLAPGWLRASSELVQVWVCVVDITAEVWFRFGTGLVQVLF